MNGKVCSAVHSHRSPNCFPLGSLKVLTPTEIRGRGGDQQHTMTRSSQQWPHTHIVVVWPNVECPHLRLLLLWNSSDELLSSLLVLGVCCGLAGLKATIGNCPVFLLPDSKPRNSQQLRSLSKQPTYTAFSFYHIVFMDG